MLVVLPKILVPYVPSFPQHVLLVVLLLHPFTSPFAHKLTHYLPADLVPAVTKAGLPASSVPALFAAMTNGTTAALEAVPRITPNIL